MQEIWKDIPNYEGLYQISNYGRVKTLNPRYNKVESNIKSVRKCHDGYYRLDLHKNGVKKTYYIHKLVALAFLPNPNNYTVVNHKDENKENNYVDNLEWCTIGYNNLYSVNSRKKSRRGIIQYDLFGNLIQKWQTISSASKTLNISRNSIFRCCNGTQNTAGNYIWKYADK